MLSVLHCSITNRFERGKHSVKSFCNSQKFFLAVRSLVISFSLKFLTSHPEVMHHNCFYEKYIEHYSYTVMDTIQVVSILL